jgi:HAMP domain-containing protein
LEAARSSTFSRLRLILAGLLNFVADASEPKAPSLKDARDDFEKSSNRLALAIASFSQSGCVRTDQVNKLLQQAGPQAASVAGHVKKNLDHLNTAVGSPMKMDEAGACQGSFTTMTRELELRIGEVTGSRKNLAQAGQKQLDLLNTLSNVDQYDVKDAKCGGRAFAGFRDSVSQAFIALDGMNKIAIALSGTETEMKAQREKHRSLLARCGQNQEAGLRSASGKARSETGREKSPRGTSQKAGSDITGVQEDGAKQKQP